jgi:hypothetical protein
MDSVEQVSVQTEPAPSVHEVMALPPASYTEYWRQFGELGSGRVNVVAERNSDKLIALTSRLYNPRSRSGNADADKLSANDIPKEWYLSLGTLNGLADSRAPLELAAATLWHGPEASHLTVDDVAARFRTELSGMQDGKTPEQLRFAIHDEASIKRMGLAGQIMLDSARIPTDDPAEYLNTAQNAYRINSVLVKELSRQDELADFQRAVLSDALKAKYDAGFAILAGQHRYGMIDAERYEDGHTQFLSEQVQETGQISDKLTNGELHEHYYIALMRYALNTWQGQQRFDVQSASRRQDEPHDKFNTSGLPNYAFDAQIIDNTGELPSQIVQLKSYRKSDLQVYADGITVVDDILNQESTNSEKREEMLAGMHQMLGLIRELRTGQMYEGDHEVVSRHAQRVATTLLGAAQ